MSPLEVVGDPVLEAGGRADLPLRELLLQAAARDLAQRLHARNPRSTEQGVRPTRKGEAERSVESTSRADGSGGEGRGLRVSYLPGSG